MGESVFLLFRDQLDQSDVTRAIMDAGGRAGEGREAGGIEQGSAFVHVFVDDEDHERDDIEDVVGQQIRDCFGQPHGSSIELEIGRADGSGAIAIDLAIALCERWPPALAFTSEQLFSIADLLGMRAHGILFSTVQAAWFDRMATAPDPSTNG